MIGHLQPRDIVDRLHRREQSLKLFDEAAAEIQHLRAENMRLRALFNDFDAEVRARLRLMTHGYD